MIQSNDSGVMITGDDIPVYRVLTIRRALILKIDTGMNLTRVSALRAAQHDGITSARSSRPALRDVNRWLTARGAEARWSKTYPNG